ncbi:LysR family transcriptional regulator [Lutibaculum baratangense]|uniref:Transcriptional regulator, LysR family n=1 Tax=Lutibaculum baratangense AMV1 TaxID=631454 RepID=V4QYG1_9HYPH|nr:LysR family transcriptional regulator [Lutibaculum baratangense]ESR24792.1 Transcriptional regulator, LysR family [Lutibaculum baratangense AMV1]
MARTEPDWTLYRAFLAVIEEGSLSGAARRLGVAQPTVGRHVAALEEALAVQLFLRSQNGLEPTEAARELVPYLRTMAATEAALRRTASGSSGALSGTVRISASEVIGIKVVPEILRGLRRRHPDLVVELAISNTLQDLLHREADIAVRMVEPTQGALVVRRAGAVALGLHARPDYLDRRGRPSSLQDLARHDVIGFDKVTPWIRKLVGSVPQFDTSRFALKTDSDLAQFEAIAAGFGIGVCQVQLGRRAGLVRLLEREFDLKLPTFVVMHENLRSTPRCRAVFDELVVGLLDYLREEKDAAASGAEASPAPYSAAEGE